MLIYQACRIAVKAGDPFYVLLCCWLAAVGGGLLKTEEILEGVARLRLSNDIEFEEETFLDMMKSAKEVIYYASKRLNSAILCENISSDCKAILETIGNLFLN